MLKGLHHIGFAVRDLDRIITLMEKTYGIKPHNRITIKNREMEAVLFKIGDSFIEYLAPINELSPLNSFINKNGEGFHHIACLVDSISHVMGQFSQGILKDPRKSDVGDWIIADFERFFDSGYITQIIEKD